MKRVKDGWLVEYHGALTIWAFVEMVAGVIWAYFAVNRFINRFLHLDREV